MNKLIKVNDNKDPLNLIWAIIVFPAVASSVFVVAPVLVGEMVSVNGFSSAEAGYIMSIEFSGMMLAAVTSYYWLGRVDTVYVVKLSAVLSTIGGVASGLLVFSSADFIGIFALRFISGIPNGAIMVVCLSTIANMRNVERGYALHTLGQVTFGGIGVMILPLLFKISGFYVAYFIMALMTGLAFPLTSAFPTLKIPPSNFSLATVFSSRNRLGMLALLGLLLFYTSLMGIWTYAERIGVASNISVVTIGTILSVTTVCGFIGAAFASYMAGRTSQQLMIVLGMLLISLSVFMFIGPHTLVSFSLVISTAKFSWLFVLPFILGLIATIDHSKRLMISSYIAIGVGTAVGPAVAAMRLAEGVDYNRVVVSSLWLIAVSAVVLIFVSLKVYSRQGRKIREDFQVNSI